MTKITQVCIAVAGSMLCLSPLRAENWPQWRGPHFDGSTTETKLPDTLDPKTTMVWSIETPGPGCATPVVFNDRIFFTSLDKKTKKLLAICASRADGKILWSKEIGLGAVTNNRNDMASPSPITDGKTVWFYFGTGDLAAFDVEGNPLWSRNLEKDHGKFNMLWLYSASPLLHEGKLYIPVLHRDTPVAQRGGPPSSDSARADSYLLCVDPGTGKDLWKVVRPTDAVQEAREAYTTPVPITVDGKTQIVIMGGDYATGHDAETGKELWRTSNYNPTKNGSYRTVASVTGGDGLVFASPPKGGAMFAIKPGTGEANPATIAWKNPEVTTDVCVPLFYQGMLYVLDGDRKKPLYCLDPKTGEKKWTTDLGGKSVFRSSPTGADGKIYCMNEAGDVVVVSVADGKILSHQSLGTDSASRASIVAADGQIFVRTGDHLYAFGKK
jgi:outer membrane protein assembly factor BamB